MTDSQTPASAWAAFVPHGQSFGWQPGVTALHVGAGVLIAVASIAIALGIAHFVRRRPDLAYQPLFSLLAAFIGAIGVLHVLGAIVVVYPAYWTEGVVKSLTALAGVATALTLGRTMPRALALPDPRALDEANAALSSELARRDQEQTQLRASLAALEHDADEHKRALADANARLEREIADHRRTDQSLRYNETLLRRLHDGLEEHITERTAELTKTISELEAFSYSISHDLRAPLRAINGYAAILAAEHASTLPADGRALLSRIETNAARMAQLIDGLLDFARLARVEVVKADVDMGELAASAAAEVTGAAESAPAELAIAELPPARGDAQMLRQVWVNLIANALKFSAPKPKPKVAIGGERRGDEIVYWVRDNGVGFDMAYAEKLFGVFHRLHRAEEFPGVGVGLAIVRRIVMRHGGRVWGESVPGEGSTFYFTVNPRAAAATGALAP